MHAPKLILLDADGTLWRGGQVLPHAREFILSARLAGLRCLLVSNNAGPSRGAYLEKCSKLGLPFEIDDIYSTNHLAGYYLAKHHPGETVLVLGSEALALSAAARTEAVSALSWLAGIGLDGRLRHAEQLGALNTARFGAVLCGIDLNVSYAKLALACNAVQRGATLIAANTDRTFPFEDGVLLPGNGSIVHLISEVCGVEPVVMGKPELHFIEQIEADTGVGRNDMLVIGDRPETDIEMAQRAGCGSILVLTGVVPSLEAARKAQLSYPGMQVEQDLASCAKLLGLTQA